MTESMSMNAIFRQLDLVFAECDSSEVYALSLAVQIGFYNKLGIVTAFAPLPSDFLSYNWGIRNFETKRLVFYWPNSANYPNKEVWTRREIDQLYLCGDIVIAMNAVRDAYALDPKKREEKDWKGLDRILVEGRWVKADG